MADGQFTFTFGGDLCLRKGRVGGGKSCEVYFYTDALCAYFQRAITTSCKNFCIRCPWSLMKSWSVIKSLGLREKVLNLRPKAWKDKTWCPACWFRLRLNIQPLSVREPGICATSHRKACPWDDKAARKVHIQRLTQLRQRKRERQSSDSQVQGLFKQFIETCCAYTCRQDATDVKTIRAAAAKYCNVSYRTVSDLMSKGGVKSESRGQQGSGRVWARLRTELGTGLNALRLLPEAEGMDNA